KREISGDSRTMQRATQPLEPLREGGGGAARLPFLRVGCGCGWPCPRSGPLASIGFEIAVTTMIHPPIPSLKTIKDSPIATPNPPPTSSLSQQWTSSTRRPSRVLLHRRLL